MFPREWRPRGWRRLTEPLDLLVVGGGITGAGILHDAVLRGLKVGLVEKGDFGSGTSSRSSKLIHGGLRYLKRMQLRITRTACRERDLLALHNPHLISPVRFLYPSYRGDATPGWQVALGLSMYDHLTPVRHRHERVEATAVRRLASTIATDDLEFGLLYDDAVADDARLVLAVLAAGVLAGGTAVSYARLEELRRNDQGRVAGAMVRDLETGAVHEVRAEVVVNATGAWCDEVRALAGRSKARVRPSRGSHLLLERRALPLECAVTGLSPDDGRPVFAVPHPEGVLIGTTDLFHDGPLDNPHPTPEEISYLLRYARSAFPGARLGFGDVCGAFAGVRPILDSGAEDPSAASREEAVWEEEGLLSTAGGKLTTYRATAEEVVDEAVRLLPEQRRAEMGPPSPGSASLPWRVHPSTALAVLAESGVPAGVAGGLVRRLGALAWAAAATAREGELEPLADDLDLCAAELLWHARFGAVVHLEDLLLRRVRLGMWQPRRCLELAPRLRSPLRRVLGWEVSRWRRELERLESAVASWLPPGVR